jgi:hypothetical protein
MYTKYSLFRNYAMSANCVECNVCSKLENNSLDSTDTLEHFVDQPMTIVIKFIVAVPAQLPECWSKNEILYAAVPTFYAYISDIA